MTGFLLAADTFNLRKPSFFQTRIIPGAGKTQVNGYSSGNDNYLLSSMAQMPVDRHDHSCGLVVDPSRGPEIVVAGKDSFIIV